MRAHIKARTHTQTHQHWSMYLKRECFQIHFHSSTGPQNQRLFTDLSKDKIISYRLTATINLEGAE